jgi:hypothetical protein
MPCRVHFLYPLVGSIFGWDKFTAFCQVNKAIDKTLLLASIPKVDNQEMRESQKEALLEWAENSTTSSIRRDDRRKQEQETKKPNFSFSNPIILVDLVDRVLVSTTRQFFNEDTFFKLRSYTAMTCRSRNIVAQCEKSASPAPPLLDDVKRVKNSKKLKEITSNFKLHHKFISYCIFYSLQPAFFLL